METMQIALESMAYGSDAVGHSDGKAVFVAGGVPGDVVEVEVTSEEKSFSRGTVLRVVEPSEDRVEPPCPFAAVCGGCPWASMSYPAQLRAKEKNVRDALVRIGRMPREDVDALVAPIEASERPWGYRNKVELAAVSSEHGIELGMHARSDDARVVPVDRCLLLPPKHQKLPKAVASALRFVGTSADLGLERVGIRVSERTRHVEIALWTPTGPFPRMKVAKVLADAIKPTSVCRVMLKEKRGSRRVAGIECLSGTGAWKERLHGNTMRLSAPSFFQVNTAGAERLIDLVLDGLEPRADEVAADLYCGAGTFTLPLAQVCDGVIAIESSGPAIRDLRRNLAQKELDDRVEAIGDDVARQPDCLEDADVVVVDPPRAGLERSVVDALSDAPARAIAYVSCDPATLARDLAAFRENGTFAPVKITPVDLFPQTFHVETVTILRRTRA